jgi:hypothetical protein
MKSGLENARRFTAVVVCVSELFPRSASASFAAVETTLVINPGWTGRAVIVTRPPAPGFKVPQLQYTTPLTFEHEPRVKATFTKLTRVDKTFVMPTSLAAVVPTFVTVIV